jgi:ribosome maturation factor RimP
VGASPLFPFVWKGGRKMAKREEYEAKTESFLMPLMEENNYELVDVEYIKEAGNWYLRAYIDKEGGITVDDCEIISRRLGEWLDENDFISDSYILEVSSPGLGRPLKKDKDFERSIGKDVDIRLYKALNKQKEFNGALQSYNKETVTIALEDGTELVINRPEIALIRLAFDF